MQGAGTVLEVLQKYIGDSVILPLFLVAVFLCMWKYKNARIYVAVFSVMLLLIFNDAVYWVVQRFGETETYYRFLWMIPMPLIVAVLLLYLYEKVEEKSRKAVLVIVFAVMIFVSSPFVSWKNGAENIYQISNEQIEVAHIIQEDGYDGNAILFGETDITEGIREYDARIGLVSEFYPLYLDNVLKEDKYTTSGSMIKVLVKEAGINYIAIDKDKIGSRGALSSGGGTLIGETKEHAVYRTNLNTVVENMERYETLSFDNGIMSFYDEDVNIEQVTEVNEIFIYPNYQMEIVDESKEKFFLEDKPFQVKEFDDFVICAITDAEGEIVEGTLDELKKTCAMGKPVILFLSNPIIDEKLVQNIEAGKVIGSLNEDMTEETSNFIDFLKKEDNHIEAIFTGGMIKYQRAMVTEDLWQCICQSEDSETGVVLRIR